MNEPRKVVDTTVAKVGLLAEPVRRALYEYVAAQRDAVDRDSAATAVGIGRPLAAFHLDRLAKAGLLDVEYRRRSGRSGPGAGRPAKFYRRPIDETVEVSLPPRRYALAAEIFAEGVERAETGDVTEAVLDAARDHGRRAAAGARGGGGPRGRRSARQAILRVLVGQGFEPEKAEGGAIRLRNCPFHALVAEHRPLTCGTNLAMLDGLAGAMPEAALTAQRQDVPGYCCVGFVPSHDE